MIQAFFRLVAPEGKREEFLDVLSCLKGPMTVSRVWDEVRRQRGEAVGVAPINYDWFILALDLLFITKAVSFDNGVLRKGAP